MTSPCVSTAEADEPLPYPAVPQPRALANFNQLFISQRRIKTYLQQPVCSSSSHPALLIHWVLFSSSLLVLHHVGEEKCCANNRVSWLLNNRRSQSCPGSALPHRGRTVAGTSA